MTRSNSILLLSPFLICLSERVMASKFECFRGSEHLLAGAVLL